MSLWGIWQRRRLPAAGGLAVCLAAIQVFIDWTTWIELNEAIVYTLPLVIAAMARSRRLLWGLTLFLIGTTFSVYAAQIPRGAFSLREPFFVNRVLTAVTVLVTAGLLHAWMLARNKLEEQALCLQVQNEQLEAANHKLLQYHEEISRQNEELDLRRREAEEASGRKTRLLASVSHDIRSPLNSINLVAQLILSTAADPSLAAEVPRLAERVQANAMGLAELVSDVLDVSALDSGQVQLHETEFALGELLSEECRRLLPLAQGKNLALTAEPIVPSLWIKSDRIKLARVIGNLVTNGIKFTESGGVTLAAGLTPDGAVQIRIRDTGVGMAPDSLERIFDEFAQLDPASQATQGWGLGLAICRRLVEHMGGTITVESQLNQGSVFSVRLPSSCVQKPSEGKVDRPHSRPNEAPGQIMRFELS
jgi:signal transduction histidine kinase